MKRALLCFTRLPVPGRTKTRLMPLLTGEECAALHTAFLRDIAEVCGGLDGSAGTFPHRPGLLSPVRGGTGRADAPCPHSGACAGV